MVYPVFWRRGHFSLLAFEFTQSAPQSFRLNDFAWKNISSMLIRSSSLYTSSTSPACLFCKTTQRVLKKAAIHAIHPLVANLIPIPVNLGYEVVRVGRRSQVGGQRHGGLTDVHGGLVQLLRQLRRLDCHPVSLLVSSLAFGLTGK